MKRYLVLTLDKSHALEYGARTLYVPIEWDQSDSDRLNYALCKVDPGMSYSVRFTTRKPKNGSTL